MPQVTVDVEVCDSNFDRTVQFLIEWVSDGEAGAREHLADHLIVVGAASSRYGSGCHRYRHDPCAVALIHERKPAGQEPDLCTDCARDAAGPLRRGRLRGTRKHTSPVRRGQRYRETARDGGDGRRSAHNPEVAGSSPAPATKFAGQRPLPIPEEAFLHVICERICERAAGSRRFSAALA